MVSVNDVCVLGQSCTNVTAIFRAIRSGEMVRMGLSRGFPIPFHHFNDFFLSAADDARTVQCRFCKMMVIKTHCETHMKNEHQYVYNENLIASFYFNLNLEMMQCNHCDFKISSKDLRRPFTSKVLHLYTEHKHLLETSKEDDNDFMDFV